MALRQNVLRAIVSSLIIYLNLQVAIISVKQATIFISWSATNADLYWYPANKSIA